MEYAIGYNNSFNTFLCTAGNSNQV